MQTCGLLAPSARRPAAFSISRTQRLQQLQCPQIAARRMVAVRAEEAKDAGSSGAAAAATEAADEVAAEQLLRRRRSSKASAAKAAASARAGASASGQQGPKVITPLRDQVYGGGPLTPEQKAENTVVATMAVLFFVILVEGVFLAGSGFMSDGLDQFAQDVVFPAFSPTVILFLAISTLYGVWKTRGAPEEGK